jgi:hypothetical protein
MNRFIRFLDTVNQAMLNRNAAGIKAFSDCPPIFHTAAAWYTDFPPAGATTFPLAVCTRRGRVFSRL